VIVRLRQAPSQARPAALEQRPCDFGMTVWTISAQPGTPGLEVAAALSARAGVPAYSRTEMVDREKAAHEVAHADHVERAWVHALFDVRVDDPTLYTICLDVSRLGVDRIVGVLSAAGDAS
jgi:hypothetical protein